MADGGIGEAALLGSVLSAGGGAGAAGAGAGLGLGAGMAGAGAGMASALPYITAGGSALGGASSAYSALTQPKPAPSLVSPGASPQGSPPAQAYSPLFDAPRAPVSQLSAGASPQNYPSLAAIPHTSLLSELAAIQRRK